MKTLLKNAIIYDGTGGLPYKADVLLEDEKISKVEDHLTCEAEQMIDLEGLSLSSGFIDAHSHNDWFAIKEQPLKYFEPFVRQGIVSFIGGNCGLSATGFKPESHHLDKIGGSLFSLEGCTGEYSSLSAFFDAIDGNVPVNIATLIGHGSVRASISGYENRTLTSSELTQMLSLLEEGLKEGACGISLGLMYEPGLYAQTDELKEVAHLCEKYHLPLTVHPRACSAVSMAYPNLFGRPHLLRALDELAEIATGTQLKLQYSHAIFVGERSLKYKDELVKILDDLRLDKIDAMFDIYANDNGVSVITAIMPVWYQAMNPTQKRQFFNKLKFSIMVTITKKLLGFGFDNILIAYAGEGNEKYEGKTVQEVANHLNLSGIDAYLHLCEISNFSGRVIMRPYNTAQITSDLSKHNHVLYMTDAWVEEKGVQNPAIYDCFPKFLHLSLNGKGDTLPGTIRKMTGAVANRFSIPNRGYIKPGYFADITVFDENKLKNGIPDQNQSFGIEMVFINGHKVLEKEKLDTVAFSVAGQALRANS